MIGSGTHAPVPARVGASGGLLLAGLVPGAAVAAVVGGGIGLGAGGALVALGVAGAARAWPLRVEVQPDRLLVRNPLRRTELPAADVDALRSQRLSQVGVVRRNGKVVRIVASTPLPGTTHDRSELFLDLRRWCAAHGVTHALPHHEYDDEEVRLDLLDSIEEVEVAATVRRTDSRGWGGWEAGTLSLPALPAKGPARWRTPELSVAGSPQSPRPVQIKDAEKVSIRTARFPEESFFGEDTSFLVITTLRRTMEIALRGIEADLVLNRLKQTDGLAPLPPAAQAIVDEEEALKAAAEAEAAAEAKAAAEAAAAEAKAAAEAAAAAAKAAREAAEARAAAKAEEAKADEALADEAEAEEAQADEAEAEEAGVAEPEAAADDGAAEPRAEDVVGSATEATREDGGPAEDESEPPPGADAGAEVES